MAATSSPSSLQLRFALSPGNSRRPPSPSPFLLVRTHVRKQSPLLPRLLWGTNGTRLERRCYVVPLIRSDSSVDGFSGWSGKDAGGEESLDSDKKKWFGGAVGAGVAGVVLVAGLTFSALSLGKRSISKAKHMEPLTTEQELSLFADEKIDNLLEDEIEDDTVKQDASSPEGGTGTYKDLSSSSELVDVPSENRVGDDSLIRDLSVYDVKNTSDGIDAVNNSSIQEDSQHDFTSNDKSVDADTIPTSYNLYDSEISNDSSVVSGFKELDSDSAVGIAESIPDIKEIPVNVESNNLLISDDVPSNLSLDKDTIPSSSSDHSFDDSSVAQVPLEPVAPNVPFGSEPNTNLEHVDSKSNIALSSNNENFELSDIPQVSVEKNSLTLELHSIDEGHNEINGSTSESPKPATSFSSAGIPAPSVVFSALQVHPGKVIEADVQPSDLCTRREYARWLVTASNALSRNSMSKVYPAMYIENVTELAFDDITPQDPDFASIQGLAEAGLISSKLSRGDMLSSVEEDHSSYFFSPESPLSRQDLVSWKMALEKRHLPEADRKALYQVSGFIDTDKIHQDACPALVADLSAGEHGIIALSFGYTRLFQPDKPVTKAQAAIALATGEASDTVSEELARIEAESMAENAVSAHTALVAEVEKDINAKEATRELERLRAEREKDSITLLKERAAIESEMEVLSRLRHEVEEQLQSLMSNKVEISYEKERITKLRKNAEVESEEILRLQHDLEVERKALSMARAWAEDEARRAREQAKVLEEARDRWERRGIKVVVDNDLREESIAGATWVDASKQFSVDETVGRAENLMDKLKAMSAGIREKSRNTLDRIIQTIALLISNLKEWACKAGKRAEDLRDDAIAKASGSAQKLQQSTSEFSSVIKDGAKRVAGDCREGVEKLTQKFKT
uniref:SLH domain-containing protein n=1 Tax=Cannabis sativa TaxID=3483 RepID=A0A803PQQ4_CANSA